MKWLEEKEVENSVVVPISPSRVCLPWSNLFLTSSRLHQLSKACRLETISFNTSANTHQGQVLVKWVKSLEIPVNENTRVRLNLCKCTPCMMTSRPPVERLVQRNMFYQKHLLLGLNPYFWPFVELPFYTGPVRNSLGFFYGAPPVSFKKVFGSIWENTLYTVC